RFYCSLYHHTDTTQPYTLSLHDALPIFPGWIEGVKVADAIILAYAHEKVTFLPSKTSGVIDVIPADLVANGILLSAAEALLQPGQHRIYQCCSSGSQPIKLGDFISHIQQEALENWNKYDRLFYR